MSTVPVTEQTITTALRRLPPERWPQVLAFIDSIQYQPKVSGRGETGNGQSQPAAAEEAELLEDAGRICLPPRAVQSVAAHVVAAVKRIPRLGADAEE